MADPNGNTIPYAVGMQVMQGYGASVPQMLNPYTQPDSNALAPQPNGCLDRLSGSVGTIIMKQANSKVSCQDDLIAINGFPVAKSISVQITSKKGAGTAAKEVFILNELEMALNNRVTNNGSGAGSITYKYSDGFDGRAISLLLANLRAGVGGVCIGVSVRMLQDKAALASELAACDGRFVTNSMFKNPLVLPFDMSTAQGRPDNDQSIEAMPCKWNIAPTTQFVLTIPDPGTAEAGNDTITTITFYFE